MSVLNKLLICFIGSTDPSSNKRLLVVSEDTCLVTFPRTPRLAGPQQQQKTAGGPGCCRGAAGSAAAAAVGSAAAAAC